MEAKLWCPEIFGCISRLRGREMLVLSPHRAPCPQCKSPQCKLTLNVNKTQMNMLSRKNILTPQNELSYEMRECRRINTFCIYSLVMQRVNKEKFLGVIVDQHLNWKDQRSMKPQKFPSHVA